MNQYVRVGVAASLIGVTPKTIRRWDKSGKITCHRPVGGHRRIALVEIQRIVTGVKLEEKDTKVAIYARVSSHEQKKKGDLERQIQVAQEYCQERGMRQPVVFTDVASGLNTNRSGLNKLCQQIEGGEIQSVLVTYQDRLTRFGHSYLERYFRSHGATVRVIHQPITQSIEEELVQDLIAIVTAFSGRVYGLRSHKNSKKKEEGKKVSRKKKKDMGPKHDIPYEKKAK
ncbi:MAG: IS607 family transposase [Candidatus Hermodarchaeota archaeon]